MSNVVWEDLVYPKGDVQSSHFPGESLETIISAWLAEAEDKVAAVTTLVPDAAVADWVYYRAFSSIAARLAAEPGSASAEGVSRSIGSSQIEYFQKLAKSHLDQFNAAITTPAITTKRPVTKSTPTQVIF